MDLGIAGKTLQSGRRRWIINTPQRRERTPGPGLDGHAGQAQRCTIITLSRLAGAQRQQFERLVAEPKQAHKLIEALHRQFVVEGQQKRFLDVALEPSMRGDMHDGELLLLQLLFQTGDEEILVEQLIASIEPLNGLSSADTFGKEGSLVRIPLGQPPAF